MQIMYVLPPDEEKKNGPPAPPPAAAAAKWDADEALRDMQLEYIRNAKPLKAQTQAFDAFTPALLAKWPKHLPLLSLRVAVRKEQFKAAAAAAAANSADGKDLSASAATLVEACDALVKSI